MLMEEHDVTPLLVMFFSSVSRYIDFKTEPPLVHPDD